MFLTTKSWDHLHIRGEYFNSYHKHGGIVGSPPHTWRILSASAVRDALGRITSTYVENTCIAVLCDGISQDHLHIRGEY